jgi:hypothetical protein
MDGTRQGTIWLWNTYKFVFEKQMYNVIDGSCWRGEAVSYPVCHLDHLKTVYMSGFRCYRAQVELLCGILEMGAALEHVTIEPIVKEYHFAVPL